MRPEVRTNVDVWALGAVYSEVLVWSISGEPGRDEYQMYRKEAIKRLGHINNRGFEACFHDGEDVLEAVKEFHDKVLKQKRENDSISEMMSRFILDDMLRGSNYRLTTNTLIRRGNELIEAVQREAVTGPPWSPQVASTHGPMLRVDEGRTMDYFHDHPRSSTPKFPNKPPWTQELATSPVEVDIADENKKLRKPREPLHDQPITPAPELTNNPVRVQEPAISPIETGIEDENKTLRKPHEPLHDQPITPAPGPTINPPRVQQPAISPVEADISDEYKDKEPLEIPAELDMPDVDEIPLFQPDSQEIALVGLNMGLKSAKQGYLKLERFDKYKEGGKIRSGLYSVPREVGETYTMFDVTGRIRWSVDRPDQPDQPREERGVQKVPT